MVGEGGNRRCGRQQINTSRPPFGTIEGRRAMLVRGRWFRFERMILGPASTNGEAEEATTAAMCKV